LRLCPTLPVTAGKRLEYVIENIMREMVANNEFESLCGLLLDGTRCHGALPEMSVETVGLFYEYFGMSAEEMQEMFCKEESLNDKKHGAFY